MTVVTDQIVNGLAIGLVYGLVAFGFTIMLKGMELFNFAHGEMLTTGAFVGLALAKFLAWPFWLIVPVVTVLTGIIGLALERVVFAPMIERKAPLVNLVLVTIGLSLMMRNGALMLNDGVAIPFPEIYPKGQLTLLGLPVNQLYLVILAAGVAHVVGLWWFFYRTKTGVALRAAAEDLEAGRLMGLSPRTVRAWTFAISGGLAGGAGVLLAPMFFVNFDLGLIGIHGLLAASFGGLYSLSGSLVGGLVLGLFETFAVAHLSSAWKSAFVYLLLLGVLLVIAARAQRKGRTI